MEHGNVVIRAANSQRRSSGLFIYFDVFLHGWVPDNRQWRQLVYK